MSQKLGKHALAEIATIVKPDTMLGWHRKCVAQKCDGSTQRTAPGRPMTDHEVEALVVRMAREHRSWGYDRLVGPLANLGDTVRAQTVALSSSAMAWHQRQSARPPPGRSSSARIWRWVRSITEEWLARMILCGEASLRHALPQDVQHLHHERHYQGKGNVLLFPAVSQDTAPQGPMQCRERLEGLLKYYTREAA
jgi:hypothetical protein